MKTYNTILDELHPVRRQLLAKYNGDTAAYLRDAQARLEASGIKKGTFWLSIKCRMPPFLIQMATHQYNLAAVIRELNLAAGLVVGSNGAILAHVGDPRSADCAGLMSSLVGPYGDARVTFDSLEGQPLPRMWAQGDSFAFVDKPSAEFMVIVFGQGASVIEQYHLSKRVSTAIGEKWVTEKHHSDLS